MSRNSNLEVMGIKVIEKVDDLIIIEISNQVINKLTKILPKCNSGYLNLYKKLLDTPMYYAEIPERLSKANYNYKDGSLYFSKDINQTISILATSNHQ